MPPRSDRRLRLAALPGKTATSFEIVPDAAELAALRDRLALSALRKVRFVGSLCPMNEEDWRLDATLGATVVQPCTITLDPVTTRIDEPVTRRYLATWQAPAEAETEMPEDDSIEALPRTLDLMAVLEEALSLALPAFPKAPGAELGEMAARPPGCPPLGDGGGPENPFAALADLRPATKGDGPSDPD